MWAWRWFLGLAIVQAVLYVIIAWLSRDFQFGENLRQRPILAVVTLFATCFALYLASLRVALRLAPGPRLRSLIVISAVIFRTALLFSQPIQEVDIYRYIWDGAVTAQGINPFRFAPTDVLSAERFDGNGSGEPSNQLDQLVALRDASPPMAEILRRVHYANLATIYPPVSQVVFSLAARLTPDDAPVATHVIVMKGVILLFDLATIGMVWQLLMVAGRHPAWVIAYAWCPLVMKEFANSGHLDSIAVFLTTTALWCSIRLFVERSSRHRFSWAAGVLLGLAVGAKLYPIVLLPLMTVGVAFRSGRRASMAFALSALAASAVTVTPMFLVDRSDSAEAVARADEPPPLPGDPPRPSSTPETQTVANPRSGLVAFLSHWEMNDFLFLIVVENLRLDDAKPDEPRAWFAVVPESWRQSMVTPVAAALSTNSNRAAFLLARIVTAAVFLGIVAWLLHKVIRNDSLDVFLEAGFLTLAWFWLLSPTQNPWYWTWALPLLPFARGRAWIAMSGLVFAYYLRFWLLYHWGDHPVLGTPYEGSLFFDFVVTWLEFGPWFLWLLGDTISRRQKATSQKKFLNR